MLHFALYVTALLPLLSPQPATGAADFASYWYSGKAEISRFELQQSRYGAVHPGSAVLIFVTEDFLPVKQVKADSSNRATSGALPILKLNFTKKFETGVYPYSIMTSVFTPIDFRKHPRTLKTTTSVQEWCGHTFLQLNWRDPQYVVQGFSYFESEGDREIKLNGTWLEDEIWTRLRLDPTTLPVGDFSLIRGAEDVRLRHRAIEAVSVNASLSKDEGGTYRYEFSEKRSGGRSMQITFGAQVPHRIEGWIEKEAGGRGVTRATRTHTLQLPYWSHNAPSDRKLRAQLGL